ncbi:putative amidohydrolase/ribosomal protein S18 acetylase RimI-like enzyme [Methylohalomonas lacus]|uniref:Amidohydrolase/ribosomal protein S18 acetylase RimI-like enzyme n=1 Tax=Methylohalomonas lacus TaxID=398773 RepID=A0AAE3HMU4_9GAMM|nr:bifunctional GNAT family N-acetyltransferase/carbon-nitrogen hydrolase family protein [Methylohalomonas lacus]MCS3904248.1 putative amidohydrolase/ribosomal protein S18 acetylase RimI-like enzyme [Methylohalomonas lacus]
MSKDNPDSKPVLIIRNARLADTPAICQLSARVYKHEPPYTPAQIKGQINNFPDGQFVAEFEGKVVGYCATFIADESVALQPHTWDEITADGFASRHAPDGDYLYGMEVFIDPDYRKMRIGQRLYNERKKLCQYLRLKGIVFGGRLPGLSRRIKEVGSPEAYVEAVMNKQFRDQVLSFQLRNGFEFLGILHKYAPEDRQSLGHAAHLVWYNPQVSHEKKRGKAAGGARLQDTIRVATVQYEQRRVASLDEFHQIVEYFIDIIADYGADFAVFPELFTLQLLSLEDRKLSPAEAIDSLTSYTEGLKTFMSDLAVRYNVNIIGGSHPTHVTDTEIQNICYVYLRDGSIHEQAKIHPTPNERHWWNINGASDLSPIMTDCGPIGVLICYDAEFPELARHLVNQGAQILFIPFCTDERQSYLRVRYCAQARAVENQCYVIMSGNVGNLPGVENMDIQYAQSCILTPCDFVFARDGIAADTTPNVETVAFADLRLESLHIARNSGTVQNLRDRRYDLYSVRWKKRS